MKFAHCIAILVALCITASGQTGTEGSILGEVRDASGASIPAASVTITNNETGIGKRAQTDSSGAFQMLALPRGLYSVTVEKQGFSTWRLTSIELTAAENKRVSPVLQVGAAQAEVTVTGGVELVQTEQSGIASSVEQSQIRELPLNGRDSIQMVSLVPGMRYLGNSGSPVDARTVQGLGMRTDQTLFSVDGQDHNDPSTEGGMIIPNLDSVAQFRVETSNFSAASGRHPLQVKLITKGGTNQLHGTLFEFLRNDIMDARNTFALTRPKLRRNQFGGSAGGPIKRDSTFFFVSFEDTKIRTETLFNSFAISPALQAGNFGAARIADPVTGQPFANNQIPTSRFSSASKFFLPYFLQPNTVDGRFVAQSPIPDDATNLFTRIDHQIAAAHRIYGRWTRVAHAQRTLDYKPDVYTDTTLTQHSVGLSYDWTVTPWAVLSLGSEFSHSGSLGTSPVVGIENLNQKAGLQGFPSSLMENTIGLPTVGITAYSGFSYPTQVPSSFKREILSNSANLNLIRGKHTIIVGAEYSDRRTATHHASSAPRGSFTFNGQYTGNSFADYLLGLVQSASRNFPLGDFGVAHSPYEAFFVQDDFRPFRNLTINVGLRYDYWNEKQFVRGCGATFDQSRGKVIAGENKSGQVDLTCQPVGPFLGPATASLWIPASKAGVPGGLFEANGYASPRIGFAWRPTSDNGLVVRGAWGMFTSSFQGNYTGSSIIGPPYWLSETITFAKASNQQWETAFPSEPRAFVAPSVVNAAYDIRPNKVEQWNFTIQKSIPFLHSAFTASYLGNRGYHLITKESLNDVQPGVYANLQNAKPYPQLGNVFVYQNTGNSWYNALQTVLERRFSSGLSYQLSWTFARNTDDFQSLLGATQPTPFAPAGYNRGPSALERRHLVSFNGIYELPFGHGKKYLTQLPKVADAILGGWEVSSIYQFSSGQPLVFTVPGTTLGNGYNTRPNLLSDPHLDQPSSARWFNPNYTDANGVCHTTVANLPCALGIPKNTLFGNAGIGIVSGPGQHTLDASLMKNFHFREKAYLQVRFEAFNAFNEVNLGNPVLNIGQANTGVVTGTTTGGRQMQAALKLVF